MVGNTKDEGQYENVGSDRRDACDIATESPQAANVPTEDAVTQSSECPADTDCVSRPRASSGQPVFASGRYLSSPGTIEYVA